ncbi:MAG: hypothetical protein JRI66_12040 [Deltaproteobacteria bacterium]|nr:hypothetical protein [Deltaproteobacteria bacterium]
MRSTGLSFSGANSCKASSTARRTWCCTPPPPRPVQGAGCSASPRRLRQDKKMELAAAACSI